MCILFVSGPASMSDCSFDADDYSVCVCESGSLASSIFDPLSALVGASGVVYALLG